MAENTPMTHMGQSAGAYPGVKPSSSRTAQGVAAAGQGRRIERIAEVSEIERALELAAVTLKPDELSARQLINRLMPSLYTLRKKGFSFAQMTRVLNQAICGSSAQLQAATVKAYYNEFIIERLDDCERNLKAALEVTAEVEKITRAAPKELIAEAVGLKNALGPKRSNATERLLNRQAGPAAGPVGGGNGGNAEQVRQAEIVATPVEIAPPAEGVKPPSAAGFESRMGKRGDARTDAPAPTPAASASFDDIPIASPIPPTFDQGNEKATPSVLGKGQDNPMVGVELVCTTSPTVENMYSGNEEILDGTAREFFSSLSLEHPCIPGLMLSKEQRMCKDRLEYTEDGTAKVESTQKMYNRLKWKKPERQTVSRTQKDFVSMDAGLFKKSSE